MADETLDLSHVPAEDLEAYQQASEQQPGEDHNSWTARVRRLEAELLGKHPKPAGEAPPAAQPAPAASPVPDVPVP